MVQCSCILCISSHASGTRLMLYRLVTLHGLLEIASGPSLEAFTSAESHQTDSCIWQTTKGVIYWQQSNMATGSAISQTGRAISQIGRSISQTGRAISQTGRAISQPPGKYHKYVHFHHSGEKSLSIDNMKKPWQMHWHRPRIIHPCV